MNRRACPLWITLAALPLVGCGGAGGEADRPATYEIHGTVTYNSAPIEGASVTFVPFEEGGKSAAGFTNASGEYSLTTFVAGDGAAEGKYRVKIVKFGQPAAPEEAATSSATEAGIEPGVPEDTDYEPAGETADTAPSNLLPPKYADPNTSGLTADVVAGDNPPQDFALQ